MNRGKCATQNNHFCCRTWRKRNFSKILEENVLLKLELSQASGPVNIVVYVLFLIYKNEKRELSYNYHCGNQCSELLLYGGKFVEIVWKYKKSKQPRRKTRDKVKSYWQCLTGVHCSIYSMFHAYHCSALRFVSTDSCHCHNACLYEKYSLLRLDGPHFLWSTADTGGF